MKLAVNSEGTQRPGNYSICLSGQTFLATIFAMKKDNFQLQLKKQYASKED